MRRILIPLVLSLMLAIAVPASAQNDASSALPIQYGQSISSTITDDAPAELFVFNGSAGEIISIDMIAEDTNLLDPRVYLYTEADYENGDPAITENDDFEGLNSRIDQYELPESTSYIIEATRWDGEGDYTITLEQAGETTEDSGAMTGEELRQWATFATATSQYGDDNWSPMQATGEPDTFECGDITTAWASSSATGADVITVIYDTPVMAEEVNIHQTYNPGSIVAVTLFNSVSGDTVIIPDSADPPGNTDCPGVFSLDVSAEEFVADTVIISLDQTIGGSWNEIDAVELVGIDPTMADMQPTGDTELSYGDTVTGEITDDNFNVPYTFEGFAGDIVSISMTAEDTAQLDTYVELYTQADFEAGNTPLTQNDDFEGLNSRIDQYELPETDTYVIVASRLSGEGSFDLTLEVEGMAAMEEETEGSSDMGSAQTITLDGGESPLSIMIPASWQSNFDNGLNIFASSTSALEVFGDEVVPAPEGEIALGIFTPATFSQITSDTEDATSADALQIALDGFNFEGEIRPYDGFAVPASFAPLVPSDDAPEDAVMFVLEFDEGFGLVVAVTGGNPQDFEADVVEIVNTMLGIEPSFAGDMTGANDGNALTVNLSNLETREFFTEDSSEQITVSVPPNWITEDVFGSIDIASSEQAMQDGQEGIPVADGELYMSVLFPTYAQETFDIAPDTPPIEALEALNVLLESSGSVDTLDIFDVPAAVSVINMSSFDGPGIVVAFGFDEGTVIALAQPGGEIDTFEEIFTTIFESITYDSEF